MSSETPPNPPVTNRRADRLLLLTAMAMAVVVGARDITDGSAVSLQGDMPRYMMNGVFLYDFARDAASSRVSWSLDGLGTYAAAYYARYPALSLGHHPPLLPAALVPAYAVFGISVFSARLAVLGFFLAAVWLLYVAVRQRYDPQTAGWASLLFASSPFVGVYGQSVLAEMPMIALVLAAVYFLERFTATGSQRDFALFLLAALVSLSARQTAAFMAPVYAAMLAIDGGWRHLLRRRMLGWLVGGAVLAAPVGVVTVALSPYNAEVVWSAIVHGTSLEVLRVFLRRVVSETLQPTLWTVVLAGVLAAAWTRDRRLLFPLIWIVSTLAIIALLLNETGMIRYTFVAMPAFAMVGAALGAVTRLRPAATVVLAGAVVFQAWSTFHVRPVGAGAYEEAAEFVLHESGAPTVLYGGLVDTGYFVFHVRRHDPGRRLVILRSDKLLTTSFMGWASFETRISSRDEIYDQLQQFGTRFVVIEDRPSGEEILDWLREEVHTDRFVERLRIPISTTDRRLDGTDLVVYEYREASDPDPDAVIDLDLPLVGRSIQMPLSDLTDPVPR